jgi:hypothetical protein
MSLATFTQEGGIGEIVIDSPPLNLFGDAARPPSLAARTPMRE